MGKTEGKYRAMCLSLPLKTEKKAEIRVGISAFQKGFGAFCLAVSHELLGLFRGSSPSCHGLSGGLCVWSQRLRPGVRKVLRKASDSLHNAPHSPCDAPNNPCNAPRSPRNVPHGSRNVLDSPRIVPECPRNAFSIPCERCGGQSCRMKNTSSFIRSPSFVDGFSTPFDRASVRLIMLMTFITFRPV